MYEIVWSVNSAVVHAGMPLVLIVLFGRDNIIIPGVSFKKIEYVVGLR